MTDEDQADFFHSLRQAIKDAGGDPERLIRMDLTLSGLCRTLAPYGIRFVYGSDNTGPTPAQRANFGQGDLAIINTYVKASQGTELFQGDLLQFIKDDGTTTPHWEILSAKDESEEGTCCYVSLNCVTKLQPIEQTSPATLSPAERAGFKVGDYAMKNDGYIVKLDLDNGTDRPVWKNIEGVHKDNTSRTHVSQVRRLVPVQERNDG